MRMDSNSRKRRKKQTEMKRIMAVSQGITQGVRLQYLQGVRLQYAQGFKLQEPTNKAKRKLNVLWQSRITKFFGQGVKLHAQQGVKLLRL